jgi:hypothetical protein
MLRKVTIHISQDRLQWFVSYEPQITIFQSVEMLLFSTILCFLNAVNYWGLCAMVHAVYIKRLGLRIAS